MGQKQNQEDIFRENLRPMGTIGACSPGAPLERWGPNEENQSNLEQKKRSWEEFGLKVVSVKKSSVFTTTPPEWSQVLKNKVRPGNGETYEKL